MHPCFALFSLIVLEIAGVGQGRRILPSCAPLLLHKERALHHRPEQWNQVSMLLCEVHSKGKRVGGNNRRRREVC